MPDPTAFRRPWSRTYTRRGTRFKPAAPAPDRGDEGESMESAPTGSAHPVPSASAELRALGLRRRSLLAQAGWMTASGVVLVLGAGGLDGAPADLQFLFLAAAGIFSLAAIHVVDEITAILHAECPRCAGRFFGVAPERLPSPFRRRCCRCGTELVDVEPS